MEITLTLCFLVSLRDRPIVIPFALSPSISLCFSLSLSLFLSLTCRLLRSIRRLAQIQVLI